MHVIPTVDGERGLLGCTLFFQDVTEARRLQDELEHANRQLESAYEELQSTNEELQNINDQVDLDAVNRRGRAIRAHIETMGLTDSSGDITGAVLVMEDHAG